MKVAKYFIFIGLVTFSLSSCSKIKGCKDKGTLGLSNSSNNTVQKIMIDGVNYGTLDPGETEEIDLAVGEHTFQQVGISGGTGCAEASVIIIECETTGFDCAN